MTNIRHLLGISGGKDSAALAIYMRKNYPDINTEYYFCDTGTELEETYELIGNLRTYLGKDILIKQAAAKSSADTPFDHFLSKQEKT